MNRVRLLTARPRRARGCFGVAVQPVAFEMADGGRVHADEQLVEATSKRLFRKHGMFDPPLPPQHEILQVERFWEELQKQILEWEESVTVLSKIRAGEEVDVEGKTQREIVGLVMLKADRVFKFFTHMRAHLDRNPRDRVGLYETRPAGMEDVYGKFLNMLSVQIDTDYCPRCHLRLDGSTSVCGDPNIVNEHLYGDNHVFGFESSELEHSFWSTSWFIEYEKRAKDLWYQALQLPFFRTSSHTAAQCEGMMEIYRKTLNRGEANHFMRQCQVHGLPITHRMVECHKEILETTNPHSLFFHGEPEAVSPRMLRFKMEEEKLEAMESEHGMVKHPPASYFPHADADAVYKALPEKFSVDERGWVTDFHDVTTAVQDSADAWSPVRSQRAQSSEFPDWCYDEHSLANIAHWRKEVRRTAYNPKPDPIVLKRKGRTVPNSRSRVAGLFDDSDPVVHPEGSLVFPTAYRYEAFDVSEESFEETLYRGESSDLADFGEERIKYAIKAGTILRATTLPQYMEPHVPVLSHKFPIKRGGETDTDKLPVVDFCTSPRAMLEVLQYGSSGNNLNIDQWRKAERPWCDGMWEALEKQYRNFKVGAKFSSDNGTLVLVGLYDGKIWAAKSEEKFASVELATNFDELKKYVPRPGADLLAVQQHVDVTGVVVGIKDGQVWVQWGANKVATALGASIEDIQKRFKNLEALGQGQPVEPPSWYIPFRNNWAETELKTALRKPWNDQPFTAHGPYETPMMKKELSDPSSYRLDDYRTREYEERVDVRNLMGGSTKLVGDRRWTDDAVHSVNMEGNNRMHTGYGQPQVDRDELSMPVGPDDGVGGKVPDWEIQEMEQSLRDIGGRAPGAAGPTSSQLYTGTTNDPIEIRKRAKLQLAMRATLLTSDKNHSKKELENLDKGQLAMRKKVGQHESWEYGGMRDPGHMQVMAHDRKRLLGEDPSQPVHQRMHLTGNEDEYLKLSGAQLETVSTFKAMNEYFDEMSKPFDVGHTAQTATDNFDPMVSAKKPSENMSVGNKRRMAGLLLRLWMRKAEDTKTTLDAFAREYQLPRLALLTWFGGDSPASPTLLAALKDWLYEDLKALDLLEEFKIEAMDTYSPVYEPGFYSWLDKSKFDHQYELLLSAKLQRYDSERTLRYFDPLSNTKATASGGLDVSETQALQEYKDKLMGGDADIMSKADLDVYHHRTSTSVPRVTMSPHTGKAAANVKSFVDSVGYEREHLATVRFGALSLADIKSAIYKTILQTSTDMGKSLSSQDADKERVSKLLAAEVVDAGAAISWAKDWREGLAMDINYAIRRNLGNKAMKSEFTDFLGLADASAAISGRFDGLYEYDDGAFRITGARVENATVDGEEWQGELVKVADDKWRAELSNEKILTVRRVSNHEIEWTYADAEAKTAPRLAHAQRADLDLVGAMWQLYVSGNWVPGADEAKELVMNWTKQNAEKVKWDLVTTGMKQADITFIRAALDAGIPLEVGELKEEDGAIVRVVKANAEKTGLVDCWVNQVPGIPSESLKQVKIEKNDTFTFECLQVAKDIGHGEGVKGPFEFDSVRTELAAAQQKWRSLGMGIEDGAIKVLARKGTPKYGALLEMLHWLDVLLTKMNDEMAEVTSGSARTTEERAAVEQQIAEFKQIQEDCVSQVITYQTKEFPECSPIVLGNSGYDASVANQQGGVTKLYETVALTGYYATVLRRYLPLLGWWDRIITDVKEDMKSEGNHLQARLGKR